MLNKDALEFANGFQVDRYGLIVNPGKFEREITCAPYFYHLSMESAQDDIVYWEGSRFDVFIVDDDERKQYPDLAKTEKVVQFESDDGFITTFLDPVLTSTMNS